MKHLEEGYKAVEEFNYKAGKAPTAIWNTQEEWWRGVANQAERILEEAKETVEDAIAGSQEGVLDGCCDLLVTVFGLVSQLQTAGYDVSGALKEVCDNNLSKILTNFDVAYQTKESYEKQGVDCYIDQVVDGQFETHYTVKRLSDNKVLKPISYKNVNLSSHLPEAKRSGF